MIPALQSPTPPPPVHGDCLNPWCIDHKCHPMGCTRNRTVSMYWCCGECGAEWSRRTQTGAK